MPQKTNLNISPYYDDFDKDDNFYRVLFKPGHPIQARELSTLQSILQNQIESFGSHMFKEGSIVIPGGVTYDSNYSSVRINSTHLGIDVNVYANNLVGKKLRGQTSGVVAEVDKWMDIGDDITDLTLFVNYKNANNDGEAEPFDDGEVLIVEETFTYGNTTVNAGETVATLVDESATAIGTAVGVSEGIYFIRGTFVSVSEEKIVLDPYTSSPSYRVGLNISEELITAKDDSSLYDNAKGYSNYAAPGADRLKISLSLSKKSLTDYDDKSFVELVRVQEGELKKLKTKTEYNLIRDYFAQRTYEESGNYAVDQFFVEVNDSLDDGISNNGVFKSTQTTDQLNTPREDLLAVKVSPGRAYVKGFDIESKFTTILDVEKTRDKRAVDSSLVPFDFGTLLRVNNVTGAPISNIGNTTTVRLQNQRRGTSTNSATGTEIGQARIYTFNLSDAPYSDAASTWDLYLFDVQTYTTLTLNQSVTTAQVPASSYIRGVSSGASGYVVTAPGGSTELTLTQTSGNFIAGEQLLINETTEISRSVESIKVYGIQDIKSVYQDSSSVTGRDFIADTVLQKRLAPNFGITDTVRIDNDTVTSPGKNFVGIKSDTIIRYQLPGSTDESFNRVVSVSSDSTSLTIAAVEDVSGVCNGALTGAGTTVDVSFSIGVPLASESGGLYAPLGEKNVASVSLSSSNILVSKQITGESTGTGEVTLQVSDTGISSAFFETFDPERYAVFYTDGTVEDLTEDQFTLGGNGTSLTLSGLDASKTAVINTTVKKNSISSKSKTYTRSEKLTINKSVSGVSTAISGLTEAKYYGTRVQDKDISLNFPDVAEVVAIYESYDTSAPTLDSIEFPSGLSLDTASVLGERVVGSTSGAIAQVVTRSSATKVEIVYLNSRVFVKGELATFEESSIQSTVQSVNNGTYQDITNKFTLDKGTKEQYYDYSRIVRNNDNYVPSHNLLVIFNRYTIPSSDTGDVYTANSYTEERYKNDIPSMDDGTRATDTIDFRPRVADFTSTTSSPFDFASRDFTSSINPSLVVTPGESSLIGYSFYLPRIDKLVLDKEGNFIVVKGSPSTDPKEPANYKDSMEIATISLPGYVYDPSEVSVTLVDNRRYTMRDIGKIEDRVENLEVLTSLSLLELDTRSLQIRDSDGLDRFKSGFFVDDFKDALRSDSIQTTAQIDSDNNELTTSVDIDTINLQVALDPSVNLDSVEYNTDPDLLDSNTQKTGNLVTLKYTEKTLIEQTLATRVENVNPFNVVEYTGIITLNPSTDSWVRTINRSGGARVVRSTGGAIAFRVIGSVSSVSSVGDTFIRSRNVMLNARSLRPFVRHYSFFDGSSGLDIIPKLIEISMTSGVFQVGETVRGYVGGTNLFTCRLVQPNHKTGPGSNPSKIYTINPYNTTINLPTAYSESSTVLNIDINALQEDTLGKFNGYITQGMIILGETSGAQATVSNIRLISDRVGEINGSIFFRDPLASPPPPQRFVTGRKTLRLTSSSTNQEPLRGSKLISRAEGGYVATGRIDTITTTLLAERFDPLAQTFTVDENGAFLTSAELFFASKDEVEKLQVQVRTVELGTPTTTLASNYAVVDVEPSEITTSTDGSVGTAITFPSPIYLEPDREYALVLLAPTSINYEVWISRMGESTVNTTDLPDAESVIATQAYTGGSLFKSQNGSIWTADQFEDLKFKLNKAQFVSSGSAYFYNKPIRSNESLFDSLDEDSIVTLPRKLKVGITTTSDLDSVLVVGRKVSDGTDSSAITGYIEQVGGKISTLASTAVGAGYSNTTYTDVPLYSITGSGTGAKATLVFSGGELSSISAVTTPGNGYVVGDVLGITTSNVGKGSGAQITVSALNGKDTLYLTNVQGEEFTTNQDLVVYSGDTAVSYANTDILSSSLISNLYDGRVIEVNQPNHGMHADNNIVTLSGIEPNTIPTTLNADLGIGDATISVANTSLFATFEGISTTTGYLKVNNEIIYYNSIVAGSGGAGTLGIGTRGIDSTLTAKHYIDDRVSTYELNGISLTRINAQHDLPSDATLKSKRDYDKYHLQINRDDRTSGDNQLSFTDENTLGGTEVTTSKNVQFNSIEPSLNVISPGETSITSRIRTVSGTSVSGSEVSFVDQGFESVELGRVNQLETTRLVASEINETNRLTTLPKNKSFTLQVLMNSSSNSNLSPAIDVSNASIVVRRNALNNPVSDYASNGDVNGVENDPHMSTYVSNIVRLKQPATSLKVLLSAYRHSSADFRVLYQLFRADSNEVEQTYELFPGYDNLKDTDNDGYGDSVIDSKSNNGRPDAFVRSSNEGEFLDYQFSADDLEQFNGFRIKIVMSGTNEAKSPRFKDLRTIALA